VVRAKTLAVVFGLTACTVTLAVAGPERFLRNAVVVLGFDDADAAPSAQELMKRGIDQYRWGHYEEATQCFEEAAKVPGLGEREQEILAKHRALMVRVNKQRQEAADLLDAAKKALGQGDTSQAESWATAAMTNGYASQDVRDEAKALLAQMQGTEPSDTTKSASDESNRRQAQQLIAAARRQLREGNFDEAESLAMRADSLQVNFGRWDDTPTKVIKDIADTRTSKPKQGKVSAASGPSAKDRAKSLVSQAQLQLKRNDFDKAEELARQATDLGASFYFYETGPADVLAEISKARQQHLAIKQPKKAATEPANWPTAQKSKPEVPAENLLTASHEEVTDGPALADKLAAPAATTPAASPSEPMARWTEPAAPPAQSPVDASPHGIFSAASQAASAPSAPAVPVAVPVAPRAPETSPHAEVQQQLAYAYKLINSGHYDEAEQLLDKAESYNLDWSAMGNPTERMRRDIAAARAQEANRASEVVAAPVDPRLQSLELLRHGRQCLEKGQLDEAEQCGLKAYELKAEYRLLDDTPNQFLADVAKTRDQAKQASVAQTAAQASLPPEVAAIPTTRPAGKPKDASRQAQGLLKKARQYLDEGDCDSAIEIARRVDAWDLDYSMLWDDTPAKVESAARAVKSRATARASSRTSRSSAQRDKSVATSLVADARKDLKAGRLDEAEEKAKQAQQLKVGYSMMADRPDAVLADVAKARRATGRSNKISPMPLPSDAIEPAAAFATNNLQPATPIADAAPPAPIAMAPPAQQIAPATEPQNSAFTPDSNPPARNGFAGRPQGIAANQSVNQNEPVKIVVPSHSPARSAVSSSVDNPPTEVVELLSEVGSRPLTTPSQRGVAGVKPRRSIGSVEIPDESQRAMPPHSTQPDPQWVVQSGGPWPQSQAAPNPVTVDPAGLKLESARAAYTQGNYPRARELAAEVHATHPEQQTQADELISRASLAEQTTTYQLYQAGEAAAKKGDFARALTFFQQVEATHVQLDAATEQQLRSYLRDLPGRVQAARGTRTAGQAEVADGTVQTQATDDKDYQTGNDVGQRERARFEQLVTETNLKVQAARQLLESDPAKAIHDLELARDQVRGAGLDSVLSERLVRRLDAAIRLASQEKQRIEAERYEQLATTATRDSQKRWQAAEAARQKHLASLVEKANALMKEGKFAEAEEIAKQARELDPDSPAARGIFAQSSIQHQLQIQKQLKEQSSQAFLNSMIAVDKSAIPFGDDSVTSIKYPDKKRWEDLTVSRKQQIDRLENSTKSIKEREIERKMSEPISVNFNETPLADIVTFIENATNINVMLDHASLAADGIRSDKPLSINLTGVRLSSALKLILSQYDLEYVIAHDVLLITTPLKSQGKLYTKTYSVTDLVIPIRASTGNSYGAGMNGIQPGQIGIGSNMGPGGVTMPSVGLMQVGSGLGGSQPLSSGGTPFGGMGGQPTSTSLGRNSNGFGQAIDFDSLIQLMQQTIEPNSWSTVGGPGTVEPFAPNRSLVINQTQAVHDQISDLLAQLRRLQDLQVAIEVRFITLNDDFFERIGIDFDIDIQSDAQKPLRSFGSVLIPGSTMGAGGGGGLVQQIAPTLNLLYNDHDDDVTVGVGQPRNESGIGPSGGPVFTNDLKIPLRTGYFGNGRPQGFTGDAFNFGIAFLSDVEVYLFLEAAQQNNRGNVLTAPKVTSYNGEPAVVVAAEIRPFITALNPVVAAGAVAFDPQLTLFPNGTQLFVTPVVSADRRYVRLSLSPQFTAITGERRFQVSGGAGGLGGGGFGGGGGGGGGGGAGMAAGAQAEIVVPIFSFNTVLTTVSVPDGGTVLMGGLKTKTELRNEYSTPILNKIPYVNRLFTDTGVQSFSTSLLLMVTPRIIIQEEEEDLLGKNYAF